MERPIDAAIRFVLETAIEPGLQDKGLDKKIRDRIANSKRWLEHFTRVGDLLTYLRRFDGSVSSDTHAALKARGLTTFEDIIEPFERRFGVWASDRTGPDSFVVGQQYDSFQLLIFVGTYDTRAGGMFVLGNTDTPSAVVIKATLDGGQYANEWLARGSRLKYYLKARNGLFGEHFRENAAILKSPLVPILAFVRDSVHSPFTYEGTFRFERIHRQHDGAKWFELVRDLGTPIRTVVEASFEAKRLDEQIAEAAALSPAELAERLATVPKVPRRYSALTTSFERSALVIAAVLARANGTCEYCWEPAPFLRAKDGTPYLEVHHRVRLADGGEDTVENALALCPNCHRLQHHGA